MSNAREIALKALVRWERDGGYSGILLNHALSENGLNLSDKALASRLVLGVISNLLFIDNRIASCSSVKISKMSIYVREILRMAVYQIFFLDRVPDSAACDEAVKLAHRYASKSSGFVNGVLRSIIRKKDENTLPDPQKDPLKYLSVKYSFPLWIVSLFCKIYGLKEAEAVMSSLNKNSELALHANTLKITASELLAKFRAEGIQAMPGRLSDKAVLLMNAGFIERLPGYDDGYFWVQDEAAQLCAQALDVKPGQTVIDVCAAPGGKSFALACAMQNRGSIHSLDIHGNKLGLISGSAERLGLDIIKTCQYDSSSPNAGFLEKADRVICDVPCSGIGVISKKPDIKWQNPDTYKTLVPLQKAILQASSRYLKAGGELVYSTCTLNPAENQEVVEDFLSENSNFEGVSIAERLPVLKLQANEWHTTLLPHIHQTDGFFIACIRRKA